MVEKLLYLRLILTTCQKAGWNSFLFSQNLIYSEMTCSPKLILFHLSSNFILRSFRTQSTSWLILLSLRQFRRSPGLLSTRLSLSGQTISFWQFLFWLEFSRPTMTLFRFLQSTSSKVFSFSFLNFLWAYFHSNLDSSSVRPSSQLRKKLSNSGHNYNLEVTLIRDRFPALVGSSC